MKLLDNIQYNTMLFRALMGKKKDYGSVSFGNTNGNVGISPMLKVKFDNFGTNWYLKDPGHK